MTTQLSQHFSLAEFTISQEASRRGLDNTPDTSVLVALRRTASCLEGVRRALGDNALLVSSGYRSPIVNQTVGGAHDSAHVLGHAIDFICPGFGSPLEICRHLATMPLVQFDQLIQEGTWVHISFDPRMRRQLLTKAGTGFITGLHG